MRGFGSLTPERRAELSAKGGRSAHRQGKAHQFTSEEARDAGRKGGATVSADKDYMARIGRKGGLAVMAKPGHREELTKKSLEARMTPDEKRCASIRQKIEERGR